MKRQNLISIFVLLVSFGGAALCGRYLYLDIYVDRASVDGLVEAGFIKEKSESVKRKYSQSMIWDLVNKNEKLFWNDSIQTADRAQATITLKDGSEIKLGAASLVILEKDNDKLSLNLKSGQLVVDAKDSKDSQIKVNGVLLKNEQGKTLALNIDEKKGQLTATSTSIDGSGKQIIVNKDGSVEEKEIPATLDTPVALYRKLIDGNEEEITFQWKSKSPQTTLEISTDKDFKSILYKKETSSFKYSGDFKAGFYYWRIKTTFNGKPFTSEARSFDIVKMQKPELVGPSPNKITYRKDIPVVEFTWKPSPYSNGYVVEAAADKDFNNVLLKDETSNTALKTSKLKEGPVYWRVSALYGTDRKPSSISNFEIAQLKEGTPPSLINPAPKFDVTYDYYADNKGIAFKWKFEDKETYRFVFSKDENLKTEILAFETSQNEALVKEKIEPGTYFWSVGYKNLDGVWTYKEIRKLAVGPLTPPLSPPTLLTTKSEFDLLEQPGLQWKWSKVEGAKQYKFKLIKTDGKNLVLIDETTPNQEQVKNDLEDGTYKWMVSSVDSYGRESKAAEKTFKVNHGEALDAPSFEMQEVQ